MRRPSFQFYPADWRNNANLRRCSWAARGVWIEVMGLLHDSDHYGALQWSLKEIAQAIGCPVALVKELASKDVLKGCDSGQCDTLIYVPRSGRKDGNPVTLIEAQDGPIWFSSRMVKDEYIRENAGASTRFSADGNSAKSQVSSSSPANERAKLRSAVLAKTNGHCHHCQIELTGRWEIDHLIPRAKGGRHTFANMVPSCIACNQDKSDTLPDDWTPPSHRHGDSSNHSPSHRQGASQSDGSTSSSSSTGKPSETIVSGGKPPAMTPDEIIFGYGVPLLTNAGTAEKQARSFLGGLRKAHGDDAVIDKLRECLKAKPLQPLEWLAKALPPAGAQGHSKQTQLESRNAAVVAAWVPPELRKEATA